MSYLRPRRGRVSPLRTSLQVDAVMRRKSHSANPQPAGCVAAAALAQTGTLRLLATADTFRGASRAYPFSARDRGGIHTERRASASGQSIEALRARRLFNGNAHVDRRAPPGRNAGGGAQGQPD